jgi:Tfp pilus assembly pilus retraction ATPase PilT
MNADELLMFGVEHRASDLYLQTGAIPSLRIDGQVHELKAAPLTDKQVRELIHAIAPSGSSFDIDTAMARGFDFSYAVGDKARFRCNLFSHLGTPALVLRVIPLRLPTLAELNLPPVLNNYPET